MYIDSSMFISDLNLLNVGSIFAFVSMQIHFVLETIGNVGNIEQFPVDSFDSPGNLLLRFPFWVFFI